MRQRRKAVLEHHHVVVAGGDLGQPVRGGWTQRALGGGREVGAGLAVTGDHHPLVDQHVIADLRRRPGRGDVAAVELGAVGAWLVVEVEQLATICQSAGCPGHVSRHHLGTSAGI
jgi:hypothetical protein